LLNYKVTAYGRKWNYADEGRSEVVLAFVLILTTWWMFRPFTGGTATKVAKLLALVS
jgi:hypothetical protein